MSYILHLLHRAYIKSKSSFCIFFKIIEKPLRSWMYHPAIIHKPGAWEPWTTTWKHMNKSLPNTRQDNTSGDWALYPIYNQIHKWAPRKFVDYYFTMKQDHYEHFLLIVLCSIITSSNNAKFPILLEMPHSFVQRRNPFWWFKWWTWFI